MFLYGAQVQEREQPPVVLEEDADHQVEYIVRTSLSNEREQDRDTSKEQNQDAPQEEEVKADHDRWMMV